KADICARSTSVRGLKRLRRGRLRDPTRQNLASRSGQAQVAKNRSRAALNADGASNIENRRAPGIQNCSKFMAPTSKSALSGDGSSAPQIPRSGHIISLRRGTRLGIEV